MALSKQTAAALNGGSNQSGGNPMKVKVLRNFLIRGKVQKEGKIIEVPFALGSELIGANKAEKVVEEADKKAAPSKPASGDAGEVSNGGDKGGDTE